tara:strand:+ start:446 stop:727 length:282 start_codon:yes stop_codon:yes gene_type:complete
MKTEKNFTTGILSGICGVLLLLVLTGTTTKETTNVMPMYEFYDLKDTRGLIFNKVTGEIKYEEIRETPQFDEFYLNLTNWNGLRQSPKVKFLD